MKFLKQLNACNLFIGLYCTYMALSATNSSSITGLMLLLITFISLGYFIYVIITMKQPKMLLGLSVVFVMLAFYGLLYLLDFEIIHDLGGGEVRKVNYLKKIAASLLPVFPFYVFAKKGQLTKKTIMFWLVVIAALSVYSFWKFYDLRLMWARNSGSSQMEFTNNTGYLFVSMLPLVFIKQKRELWQYAIMGLIAVFAVMSAKRGAILITGLSICYYMYSTISAARPSGKSKYILLSVVAVLVAGYYINDYITHSEYFAHRVAYTMKGGTSHRDSIYSDLWNNFLDSGFFYQLFGHGADRTIVYSRGFLAHNDWLEILTNQGLVGCVVYIIFFIILYRTWRKYKDDKNIGMSLGGLFIVLFFRTFFSMSYTEYTLAMAMAFGYCAAAVSEIERARRCGKRITA